MTNAMKLTGILATIVIVLVIPLYTILESSRQEELLLGHYTKAIQSSTDLYAENCALCHGAAGEGIAGNPPLDSEAIGLMSEHDLTKVISRGRDGTLMAAWAVDEGGIFTNSQINDMVILIQNVDWGLVESRVAELGLTPPEMIEMTVPDEMLASVAELPDGETLSEGLAIYAENCAACHGADGAGTAIAPAIDSAELRDNSRQDLTDLINNGVPGTLMAGWQTQLQPDQINAVVDLIYRWPELRQSGIEIPQEEVFNIATTPEMIQEGQELFNIACKSCHGVDGYGTRMAPALNNQLFLSKTPDEAIYQIIANGVPGTLMPGWGGRLTDYDMQSLVAFMRSLETTAPSILPPIEEP